MHSERLGSFLREISAIAGKERWGLGNQNQNQREEGVGVLYYCKVV
jgi:hypothetical protein